MLNNKIGSFFTKPHYLLYFMPKDYKENKIFVASFLQKKKKESELFFSSLNSSFSLPTSTLFFGSANRYSFSKKQPMSLANSFPFCLNISFKEDKKNLTFSSTYRKKRADLNYPSFLNLQRKIRIFPLSKIKTRCLFSQTSGYVSSFLGGKAVYRTSFSTSNKTSCLNGWSVQNLLHYGSLKSFYPQSKKLKWDSTATSYYKNDVSVKSIYFLQKTKIFKIKNETSCRKR